MENHVEIAKEGELSDTDDFEHITQIEEDAGVAQPSVVVTGEASESDDEDIQFPTQQDESIKEMESHPITKEARQEAVKPQTIEVPQKASHKHNTLLHKKLREQTAKLNEHIRGFFSDTYLTACKDLSAVTLGAKRAQNGIQEASNALRLCSNELFQLEDKLDIVTTCSILPDLCLPSIEQPVLPITGR